MRIKVSLVIILIFYAAGAIRFLEIEVRRSAGENHTTLTPRQPFTSTSYSIRSRSTVTADNSNQLGGINASQYVQTNDLRLSDARTPTAGSNFAVDSAQTNAKLFISQYNGTTFQDRLIINPNGAVAIPTLGSAGSTSLCRNANNEIRLVGRVCVIKPILPHLTRV